MTLLSSEDDGSGTQIPSLRFVHFNDVYHIAPVSDEDNKDIPGGAARFVTAVEQYRLLGLRVGNRDADNIRSKIVSSPIIQEADKEIIQADKDQINLCPELPQLITVFSGDAFSPSLEATLTKGRHMIPVLNRLHIDVSVCGNHEFDFGVDQLDRLLKDCNFPWLLSNARKPDGQIADTLEYYIKEVDGYRLGFIGLIEKEWLDTIPSVPAGLVYEDFRDAGRRLSSFLRNEKDCDLVLVLSHMREPNAIRLAKALPRGSIDFVFGGHDHFYSHKCENGVDILCSGTDFYNLSYIEAFHDTANSSWRWTIKRRDITSDTPENPEINALTKKIEAHVGLKLSKVVAWTPKPLDVRFSVVRTQECFFGNLVCDIMRRWYDADVCVIPGGTFRSDTVIEPGKLCLRDLVDCFPYEDACVVMEVPGSVIFEALENSVSKLPAMEGRFLQVSGIKFVYSLETSPRVHSVEVTSLGEKLDLDKIYKFATRAYIAKGKDGYDMMNLSKEHYVVDEEEGLNLVHLLRMWFLAKKYATSWFHGMKRNGPDHTNLNVGGLTSSAQETPLTPLDDLTPQPESIPASRYDSDQDDFDPQSHRSSRASSISNSGATDGLRLPTSGSPREIAEDVVSRWTTFNRKKVKPYVIHPRLEGRIIRVDAKGNIIPNAVQEL